jgi:hypothetical protein
MNTLNKTQVKRLANSLELAKLKHGSELNYNDGYRYYVDSKNVYHTLEDSIHKNIFISHFTTYNMWSVTFNPLLSKTEINIILTKIEEELENE